MAGRIPDEFIDRLLGQTDIVRLINQYVPLKKSGVNYTACCPFHEEKTPSFSVHAQKQFYHCFGCGESGSAIQFLMKHRHMTFVDAIETLAKQAGLTVPRTGGSAKGQEQYRRGLEVLQQASQYYVRQLGNASNAMDYLRQRGLDEETIKKYNLGYAPGGSGSLRACFKGNYDERQLLRVGLLRQGDHGSPYEFFKERVMFPILDRRGQVVAFGARALSESARAKYINSPETPWFNKSRVIYGEHELKTSQRDIKTIFVVEGYMDVVSLSCHGVPNAVAAMGTAVTEQHMRTLMHLCPNIVFCFDGDTAGQRAAIKTMEQTLSYARDESSIRFMFLSEKHDPDSFVREQKAGGNDGAAAFHQLARQAPLLSEFLISHLTRGQPLENIETRAAFASKAKALLTRMPKTALKTLIMRQVAERAGISDEDLRELLSSPEKPDRPGQSGQRQTTAPAIRTKPRGGNKPYAKAIRLLLYEPDIAEQNKQSLSTLLTHRPQHKQSLSEQMPAEHTAVAETLLVETLFYEVLNYLLTHHDKSTGMIISHFDDTKYAQSLKEILHQANTTPNMAAEFKSTLERISADAREKKIASLDEKGKLTTEDKQLLVEMINARTLRKTP